MLSPMISLPSPYRVLWWGGSQRTLRTTWEEKHQHPWKTLQELSPVPEESWERLPLKLASWLQGNDVVLLWQRPCSSRGKVSVISTTGVSLGWSNQMVHPRGILCSDNWSQCPNSIKGSDLNETCFLYSSICILSLRDPMTSISICSNNSGFSPVTCNEQLLHL